MVGSINVTKGFTPEFYGDFSGGAVDIRTKRATGENVLQVSVGGGMNSRTTFKNFTSYNGGGQDLDMIELCFTCVAGARERSA